MQESPASLAMLRAGRSTDTFRRLTLATSAAARRCTSSLVWTRSRTMHAAASHSRLLLPKDAIRAYLSIVVERIGGPSAYERGVRRPHSHVRQQWPSDMLLTCG